MIEIPEAAVLAEQVRAVLTGRTVTRATANAFPHTFAWYTGDPAGYNAKLAGKAVSGAASCGGHVEIQAGDMLLVLSAPLRYHKAG